MGNELVASEVPPKRLLIEQIERLAVSADAKAILRDLAEITVSVSGKNWSLQAGESWHLSSRQFAGFQTQDWA
jgi:hypothetical protein